MIQFPGVEFDFDHSMVYFDGIGFPACSIILAECSGDRTHRACEKCILRLPDGGCWDGMEVKVTDDALDEGWVVSIPAENGALFKVSLDDLAPANGGPGLGLTLYLCSSTQRLDGDMEAWIACYLSSRNGVLWRDLRPGPAFVRGQWYWPNAEPGWIAEQIQRLSRFPIEPRLPPRNEQPVTLLPISDPRVRPKAASNG